MRAKVAIKISLLVLFLVCVGCEGKPKFEVYENEVIACCGVQKPSNNLVWLREFIHNEPYPPFTAKLYQGVANESFKIVIQDRIFTYVFDCNGNLLLYGNYLGETGYFPTKSVSATSPIPCNECGNFFKTHKLIGTIYEMKIFQ